MPTFGHRSRPRPEIRKRDIGQWIPFRWSSWWGLSHWTIFGVLRFPPRFCARRWNIWRLRAMVRAMVWASTVSPMSGPTWWFMHRGVCWWVRGSMVATCVLLDRVGLAVNWLVSRLGNQMSNLRSFWICMFCKTYQNSYLIKSLINMALIV